MSNFFVSSIGKKFVMSVTGMFLILFLIVHLTVNSMIIIDDTGALFNKAAHFMATNPIIKIIEPILAIGVILHILFASLITLQNQLKRDINYPGLRRYKKYDTSASTNWQSRNMYILGTVILTFLVIHLINFFWKIRYTGSPLLEQPTILSSEIKNVYALVTTRFTTWWYVLIYVIGAVALGLHLYHGVWSAFQTLGWSNRKWRKILNVIGVIISVILGGGFAFIPLFVFIKSII
ncbi:MAG TPA: succinate dehydrogenase [Bacteroidales bacterium]|nr:succinate dehydrogenase [Bacteroidales bacterium]